MSVQSTAHGLSRITSLRIKTLEAYLINVNAIRCTKLSTRPSCRMDLLDKKVTVQICHDESKQGGEATRILNGR